MHIPYQATANRDYYMSVAYNHEFETQPDLYFFNFGNKSGQFTYDSARNIIQAAVSPLKITRTAAGFEILDDSGNLYEFTTQEFSSTLANNDADVQPHAVTSWWLTRITAANKIDIINFSYSEDGEERDDKPTYSDAYGDSYTLGGELGMISPTGKILDNPSWTVMNRTWNPQRLDSITFSNGKVVFNRVADRQDGGSSRLSTIEIFRKINEKYEKMRSLKLNMDYFHCTGQSSNTLISYSANTGRYRLKLTFLEDYDAKGVFIDRYEFGYNEEVGNELPFRGSYQQDYWGYYNGVVQNDVKGTLLPLQNTDDFVTTVGGADRNPNVQFMKAGMLTKIVYPTKGYSLFNWEAHRFANSSWTVDTNTAESMVYGNNSYNNPQPTDTTYFTVPEFDEHAVIRIVIPPFPSSTPPYEDPIIRSISEDDHYPNVTLIDVDKDSVVYREVNTFPSFLMFYSKPLMLPPGNYKLIANCFVNDVSASADITVEYHTTRHVVDVRGAGGLRIADIKNYDYNDRLLSTETYKYGENESGYGNLSLDPLYSQAPAFNKIFKYWFYLPSPISQGGSYVSASSTRKVYRAESIAGLNLASGSSVVYNEVAKYIGNKDTNTGKTIFRYRNTPELETERMPDGEYLVRKLGWVYPRLEDVEDYARLGGAYKMIRKTHNVYTIFADDLHMMVKHGMLYENKTQGYLGLEATDFYTYSYYYHTAVMQMTSSITQEFDDNENVTMESTKTFDFDNIYHSFPVSESTRNSKDEEVRIVTKYSFQKSLLSGLTSSQSSAIDRLLAKNVVAVPIEKLQYKNSVQLQRYRTNFKIWDGSQNIIKPESIDVQVASNPTETPMSFEAYDGAGNLLLQRKLRDVSEAYIWDYNATYPIAGVKNAQNTEIAYTSFETDGAGNWSVSASQRESSVAITGKRSYAISAGSISKFNLSTSGKYIVSYWKKGGSGSLSVSGATSGKTGATVDGWTYYEHVVSGVTSVTLSGTGGYIDDVRLYPMGSIMTTYTYDVLAGATSMTDANNLVTYYKYDDFGRLQVVKDNAGNVVKTYQYNYKGK